MAYNISYHCNMCGQELFLLYKSCIVLTNLMNLTETFEHLKEFIDIYLKARKTRPMVYIQLNKLMATL